MSESWLNVEKFYVIEHDDNEYVQSTVHIYNLFEYILLLSEQVLFALLVFLCYFMHKYSILFLCFNTQLHL